MKKFNFRCLFGHDWVVTQGPIRGFYGYTDDCKDRVCLRCHKTDLQRTLRLKRIEENKIRAELGKEIIKEEYAEI